MPLDGEINWGFVIGFGLIGLIILTHIILSLLVRRAGGRFGRVAYRDTQPVTYWVIILFEMMLVALTLGGVGLYLWQGGTPTPGSSADGPMVIQL